MKPLLISVGVLVSGGVARAISGDWSLAVMAAVIALCAWGLWWELPKWQATKATDQDLKLKAKPEIENDFRVTVSQLLGGAALLIGAAFAYVQFTTQRQQFEEQQKAARDLLISNQVAKGFELLGNKDNQIQQQLGGIYALEGVMNTSKEYYQPVLEALCAFVRDKTKADKKETREGPPASDVQAALTVIGRRAAAPAGQRQRIYLSGARIPEAVLLHAKLSDMYLDHAVLTGAWMNHADLSTTELVGDDLSHANLGDANLSGANLEDANLSDANLEGANLHKSYLHNANLISAHLSSAALSGANLEDANLEDANLTGANLSDAHLNDAPLTKADLIGANLNNTTLTKADLSGANLRGTTLTKADLSGANLSTVVSQRQLDQACGTGAKLDPGLTLKPCPTPKGSQ